MSMYRRNRGGFSRLEPDEVAVAWNGRGLARFASPHVRHELRSTTAAVERGWRVVEPVKDLAVGVTVQVLSDAAASDRDKLTAVKCVLGMVRTDVTIDQAGGDDAKMSPGEYAEELRRRIVRYEADPCPDPVPDRVVPARPVSDPAKPTGEIRQLPRQ